MSTDDLQRDLTRRTENSPQELLTRSFFFLCAVLSIVTTVAIILMLTTEAAKFFTITAPLMGIEGPTASVVDFLTGTEWVINNEQFGVLPLVSATLAITIGSAVVALPLGVATAISVGILMIGVLGLLLDLLFRTLHWWWFPHLRKAT